MKDYDPNACASEDSGIFGLPYSYEESKLVLHQAPWEATVSYRTGTLNGPKAILQASKQIDMYHESLHRPYEAGIFLAPEPEMIYEFALRAREHATKVIDAGGDLSSSPSLQKSLDAANELCSRMNEIVYQDVKKSIQDGKLVGLLGGDHSVPYGAIKATAEKYKNFGILHFDAHLDLRKAYEGFTYSHASIMRNVMEDFSEVQKLVQVGIRDTCEEEVEFTKSLGHRSKVFTDLSVQRRKLQGEAFSKIADEIIRELPENVYFSFDIDGLEPHLCPNTGTPVPGGLSYHEALMILEKLSQSGRKIIGFDVVEVAPDSKNPEEDSIDANIAMRLLYQICSWTLFTQGFAKKL